MASFNNNNFVLVSTTSPILEGNLLQQPITTDRLIFRQFLDSDLEAIHSSITTPGEDDKSQALSLLNYLKKDSETLHLGIFLNGATEGEFIGRVALAHSEKYLSSGWPEIECVINTRYRGCGYATESATALLQFFWDLPRKQTRILVAPSSLDNPEDTKATEQIYAMSRKDNLASIRVLQKLGFESFEGLDNDKINWRMRNPFM
ncbi:n- gnat protein [Lasius niger]|uniref:N-gnat protein n=1 Tax=Lasius niger TaxID=67767 RepID=A0A0J7JW94_LASNI|nr:n- gnat protein [Lasius niger]